MGMHLRQRIRRRVIHRIQSIKHVAQFVLALFSSYRMAEFLPLTPLLVCLAGLSCLPDWVLQKADQGAEWLLCILLGGKCARLRDASGQPTGQTCLYSVAGALDPEYDLPDKRLLCVPQTEADRELAFPSKHAAGWGNATFLAMCMKLAYEDWEVVRDVVNHEWKLQPDEGDKQTYLAPRFVKGCSFHFMQPAGVESSQELSHIHLDSDACLIAVEDPNRPASSAGAAEEGATGAGVALVLAFRGTEPLELSDFQSDFDAVPEAGDWGSLHPGFLLALGLDPNINPYHQTLTTYTALKGDAPAADVVPAREGTPYEVLRDQINAYMIANPAARLYVTGHSLGGALAVVFMGALMHDKSKEAAAAKARVGALYTFGQPRVGDYEFLCHLQVSLLEPSIGSGAATAAAAAGSGSKPGTAGSDQSANGRLRGLFGASKQQSEESAGPPLTSRYIRVVNTYDIVPHIPPTLCNIYQHGGDLLYLQMVPGQIKFLTEQPMFFISGIFTSSVCKLYHFGGVKLGLIKNWKGSDNYLRFGMRLGAVLLPFLIAGLNDHMPGDYMQQVANSQPEAWQPFRARKKLSRWANALMFARALSSSKRSQGSDAAAAAAVAASEGSAGTADSSSSSSSNSRAAGGHATLSAALQARLLQHAESATAGGSGSSSGSKTSSNGTAVAAASGSSAAAGAAAKGIAAAADAAEQDGSSANGGSDTPVEGRVVAATKRWARTSP